MTAGPVHREGAADVVRLAAMNRALVVAALALCSAAAVGGGCGGKPLALADGGRAQAGSSGNAGTTGAAGATSDAAPALDAPVTSSDAPVTSPDAADARTADTRDGSAVDRIDGTGLDVKAPEAPPSGWLAYDVTATVALKPLPGQAASLPGFPTTVRFPIAYSPARALAIIGSVPTEATPDGAGFRINFPSFVDTAFAGSCEGTAVLDFDTMTVSLDANGTLHGQAMGQVRSQIGEALAQVPATFSLVGGHDVTPPTLNPVTGALDPLSPITPLVTEVMAPGASLTLVGTASGDSFPLVPYFLDDDPTQPVLGFSLSMPVMLRWNEVYKVVTRGVTDLAGNELAFATPPTATTPAPPPLQPEDGFEAVTGTTYAGAGVLEGGPLAPIAGTTSLLVGNVDSFLSYKVGASFTVRLAVAPGDTVLRFDTRLAAPNKPDESSQAFRGGMFVGAVGKEVQGFGDVLADTMTKVSLAGGATIWQSPIGTTEIPLPTGATGEVSFEIIQEPVGPPGCGFPVQSMVLVIDRLRVE